jgi:hypothetical protein
MSIRRAFIPTVVCLALPVCAAVLSSNTVSFEAHTTHIAKRIASPDGNILVTLNDEDRTITLFDQTTGEERAWRHEWMVCSMAFSPDGKTLVSGGIDGIRLWDVAMDKERGSFVGQGDGIMCVAISPDGKTLASGSLGDSLWLWDWASGKRRYLEEPWWLGDTSVDYPTFVAFSPDGKTLASIVDERVGLWDVESGKHTATLDRGVRSLTFTTDGKLALLLENDKRVKIQEVAYAPVLCIGVVCALGAIVVLCLPGGFRSIYRRFSTAETSQNLTRSCASTSKSNGFGPVTGVTTPTASRARW